MGHQRDNGAWQQQEQQQDTDPKHTPDQRQISHPPLRTHDTEHGTRFSCLSITFCQLPIHCGSSVWFEIAPPVGHPIRLCHAGPIIPSHLHAGWRCTCDAVSRNLRAAGLLVYARGTGHARQTCLKRTCLCYLPATPPRGRWLY